MLLEIFLQKNVRKFSAINWECQASAVLTELGCYDIIKTKEQQFDCKKW